MDVGLEVGWDEGFRVTGPAGALKSINANIIIIAGSVKGNIKASSRVEILKPARFEGIITTPSLIVEEGVIFHGTTKMRDKKNPLN